MKLKNITKKTLSTILVIVIFCTTLLNNLNTAHAQTMVNCSTFDISNANTISPDYEYTPYSTNDIKSIVNSPEQFKATITNNINSNATQTEVEINIQKPTVLSKNNSNLLYAVIKNTGDSNSRYAYIEYYASAYLYIDGQQTEKINITDNNLIYKKSFTNDNKTHSFQIVFTYNSTGKYCETETSAFTGVNDKVNAAPKISAGSNTLNIAYSNQKCTELGAELSNTICEYVGCLKKVYNNTSYWKDGKAPAFGETTGLNDTGKTEMNKCSTTYQSNFTSKKNQYQQESCTDPISWPASCKFDSSSGDTDLLATGDTNTANNLNWLASQLNKISDMIPNIETYNSDCENKCKSADPDPKPVGKYICISLCWVGQSIYDLFNFSFSILRSAITTESDNPESPTFNNATSGTTNSNSSTNSTYNFQDTGFGVLGGNGDSDVNIGIGDAGTPDTDIGLGTQ